MLISVVALLVAGTGVVLIPRESAAPPVVPFSETARAAAFQDTLLLRDSAAGLADAAGADPGVSVLGDAVTLLTTHARALLAPSGSSPTTTGSAAPQATPETPAQKTPAGEPTRASLVAALATSGQQRLDDAREADGGIARLLAAVGSAQLLHSERLAAAWKLKIPALSSPPTGSVPAATPCPSVTPSPETETDAPSATTNTALAATVRSEQEFVYVYQVALKRLGPAATAAADAGLSAHELMLQEAEALTRAHCGDVPASEPGYRLPEQFHQDPAASLGTLEASSLPGFGDLVALSTGETRAWAIDNLLAAGRRSLAWGAALPALPGLTLDAGDLPPLPTSSAASTAAPETPTGGKANTHKTPADRPSAWRTPADRPA